MLTKATTTSQSSNLYPDFVILLHQSRNATATTASTSMMIKDAYSEGCLLAYMSRPEGGSGIDMSIEGREVETIWSMKGFCTITDEKEVARFNDCFRSCSLRGSYQTPETPYVVY